MINFGTFGCGVAAGAAIVAALHGPALAADSAADFYRGKQMEFVIGSAPGGGFDVYGRAVATHIVRHIPGNPTIVVKNMPGAGSLKALQYMNIQAPRDGTVIGIVNPSLFNNSVTNPEKVQVNLNDMTWLGNVSSDAKACFAWTASGINTLDDIKTKKLRVGGTTQNAGSYPPAAFLRHIMGENVQNVLGYASNSNIWLALESGEVEGSCTGWGVIPTQKPDWVRDKKLSVLIKYTKKQIPGLEGVPSVYDLPIADTVKNAISFIMRADETTRPIMAPPGVPAERAKVLREAFDKMLKDPVFLAFAKKSRLDLDPMNHKDLAAAVKAITSTPKADVALAKELLK